MKNADMPAFPVTDEYGRPFIDAPTETCTMGLTKREYFAALAMQGLTSSPLETEKLSHAANKSLKVFVVEQAVAISDALLAELSRSPTHDNQ